MKLERNASATVVSVVQMDLITFQKLFLISQSEIKIRTVSICSEISQKHK